MKLAVDIVDLRRVIVVDDKACAWILRVLAVDTEHKIIVTYVAMDIAPLADLFAGCLNLKSESSNMRARLKFTFNNIPESST